MTTPVLSLSDVAVLESAIGLMRRRVTEIASGESTNLFLGADASGHPAVQELIESQCGATLDSLAKDVRERPSEHICNHAALFLTVIRTAIEYVEQQLCLSRLISPFRGDVMGSGSQLESALSCLRKFETLLTS